MRKLIQQYIAKWKQRGYPEDIPDEVPSELMRLNLAPSYKAIAIAILSNDHGMTSLGFAPKHSPWYDAIKKVELEERRIWYEQYLKRQKKNETV